MTHRRVAPIGAATIDGSWADGSSMRSAAATSRRPGIRPEPSPEHSRRAGDLSRSTGAMNQTIARACAAAYRSVRAASNRSKTTNGAPKGSVH
jgi:hypothetical protein